MPLGRAVNDALETESQHPMAVEGTPGEDIAGPALTCTWLLEDPKARQGRERTTHWGASPFPGPPLGRQMVIGVRLLDSGEKRARSVPEKGVSGKA